jgi:N-acetylglucosamine-6-phosphate deacetylase
MHALTNAQIYTGQAILTHHAVLIEAGVIEAVLPNDQLPADIQRIDLEGNDLTAGFIDFQVYGGDTDFFVKDLSFDSLQNIVETHRQDGTINLVPTLYSTTFERIITAIDVTKNWIESGRGGVAGLHIEGPYLNPEKRGAHNASIVRIPTRYEIEAIIERSVGLTTIMTIAPEIWPDDLLELALDSHLILSVGHTNAIYKQTTNYFKKGIGLATHLYNAMRPFEGREPGVVGAILDSPSVCASIIVDGFHCDYAAVRIAKNILGERLFLISDATFAHYKGQRFEFEGFSANYINRQFLNDEGKLAGSAITLLDAVQNCVNHVGIAKDEAFRMASLYPARALKINNQLGRIAAGYKADLVVLDKNLGVLNQKFLMAKDQ